MDKTIMSWRIGLVAISDIEKLTVELNIDDVDYIPSEKTAKATFKLRVKYEGRVNDSYFSKIIKTSDVAINKIKEQVDVNNKKLIERLEKIKDRINALLILDSSIDVELSDIGKELIDVAKKGLIED